MLPQGQFTVDDTLLPKKSEQTGPSAMVNCMVVTSALPKMLPIFSWFFAPKGASSPGTECKHARAKLEDGPAKNPMNHCWR